MWELVYPIIVVLAIGIALFVSGTFLGAIFLRSRFAQAIKAHPKATRFVCLGLVLGLVFGVFFLFIKIGQPFYRVVIVCGSCLTILWGFFSGMEKRILWKELFTFSFWFSTRREGRILAKDGT